MLFKQTMLGPDQYAIYSNPKRGFESVHKLNWQEILSVDFVLKGNSLVNISFFQFLFQGVRIFNLFTSRYFFSVDK